VDSGSGTVLTWKEVRPKWHEVTR